MRRALPLILAALLVTTIASAGDQHGLEPRPPRQSATAAQVSYTPANAGQWAVVVNNVGAALDALANAVSVLSGLAYAPAAPSDWITSPAQIPTALDQLAQRTGRPLEFAPKVLAEEFVTFGSSGTVTFGDSTNWQTSSSGTGSSCRFEDVATGNLVKPSRASLLVQVPS